MDVPNNIYPRFQVVRTFARFAGIIGVTQSIIWIGFAITGMLAYFCIIDFGNVKLSVESSVRLTFFEVYFRGTCTTNEFPISGGKNFDDLRSMTVLTTNSINICLWIHLVLNILWFLSSISLIKNVEVEHLRRTNILFYIWIFITLDIMAFDLGLSVVFGLDYDKFSSESVDLDKSTNAAYAVILGAAKVASISMLIIAVRGFILWVINLCFAIYFFAETFSINDAAISQTSLVNQDVISDTHSIQKGSPIIALEANNPHQNNLQVRLNTEALERANKMSLMSLKDRFTNRQNSDLNRFKEYAPRWEPNVPAPDYTPPMPRSQLFQDRNFQSNGNTRF